MGGLVGWLVGVAAAAGGNYKQTNSPIVEGTTSWLLARHVTVGWFFLFFFFYLKLFGSTLLRYTAIAVACHTNETIYQAFSRSVLAL